MFSLFLEYAKMRNLRSLKLPALRIISCSGAPLPPVIKSSVEGPFGLPLHHGYGITECSPNIAQVRLEAPPRTDNRLAQCFREWKLDWLGVIGSQYPREKWVNYGCVGPTS